MDTYKNWLKKLAISISIAFVIIGLPIMTLNYIVDPLWLFQHQNKWNDIQQGFNERQQKVNKFTFSDQKYDALLLGSSRSTYINQHDFKDMDVFNFAVSSMYVEEYKGYLDYAKKVNGKPFDYVFLGLDFFASNQYRETTSEKPSYYIDQTTSYLYRFKSLASFDTMELSWPILKSSQQNAPVFIDHRFYNRKNEAFPFPVTDELRQKRIETNIGQFFGTDEPYKYDKKVKDMLQDLVDSNPNTKFIVFTTPVTLPRLVIELQNEEYLAGYEQWLKDIVDVFGSVHHFMDVNDISTNLTNFVDSHHFKPEIGTTIVNEIWNERENSDHISKLITKDNVEMEMDDVKKDIFQYRDEAYAYLNPLTKTEPFYQFQFHDVENVSFATADWKEQLTPLKLQGAKGQFELKGDSDGLGIKPIPNQNSQNIQIGYNLQDLKDNPSDEITFIASLKGKVSENGAVQLIIQDEVNGNWERKAYNTILSPEQFRSFKVQKPIRKGATNVLIGIRWQNIASPDEWIQMENLRIY